MTATIFFIRHAAHEHIGRTLSGRQQGLGLTADGRAQAKALSARLAGWQFGAIYSSPVQRARETAQLLADERDGGHVFVDEALDEVDFGRWTGMAFADLEREADWHRWNAERGSARVPDGESMAEVQARVVAQAQRAARAHAGVAVALVSHMDVIRAAIAHYLGLPLDRLLSFDIDPASFSRVTLGEWGGRVMSINETAS